MHDDDSLMVRVASGDGKAFGILWSLHQGPLTGFFQRQLRDFQLAEDLCQETMLRIHAASGDYIPNGTFKAWMYRIARNLLVDTARRRSHDCLSRAINGAADDDCNEIVSRVAAEMAMPEESVDNHEIAQQVSALLDGVPDEQRVTFILHVYAGMSLPEVAEAMESNLPTTKSRLRLAREKIRAELALCGRRNQREYSFA